MKIKVSTRVVLIFKDYVYKFPISIRGFLQCKQEYTTWKNYRHTNLLGELIWYRFGIIKMKKYNVCSYIGMDKVYKAKLLIPHLNFKNCDLFKSENWGKCNDENYYLIDYGINQKISKMYKNA